MNTPEVTQALFECWKSLTGEDDLACYARLLSAAQDAIEDANAPFSIVRQLVEEARAALKKNIKPSMNVSAAMELHKVLLRFIDTLTDFKHMPEWATTTLGEMASDPVSHVLRQVNPNAAAWPVWIHALKSLKALSKDRKNRRDRIDRIDQCLLILTQCTALDGAVQDYRLDSLFLKGIRQLVEDADEHCRPALQAFMLWRSIPRGPNEFPRRQLGDPLEHKLVTSLRKIITDRVYPGVDVQQAMHALLATMLHGDPKGAVEHLDAILASRSAQRAHPMLGVNLCKQFANHFRACGDEVRALEMDARAFAYWPTDPQQPLGHVLL